MVKGRLLTTRPGSVHDSEEASGGQSSLGQGTGKRSLLTLPILEAMQRRNDGEIDDSRKSVRVSSWNTKYRPKEGTGGDGAHPGELVTRPRAWPRQQAVWEAPRPPLALLR